MLRTIKAAAIGLGTLGLLVPLTTAASADDNPATIMATATVAQTLTLSGVSPTVAFGAVQPGQPATVTGAEKFTVTTNGTNGASVSLVNNGAQGWAKDPDAAVVAGYDILTVRTAHGDIQATPGPYAATALESAPMGSTDYSHDWTINVPATIPGGTSIFARYNLTVTAN